MLEYPIYIDFIFVYSLLTLYFVDCWSTIRLILCIIFKNIEMYGWRSKLLYLVVYLLCS